jgi:hypothetical protein
VRIITRAPSHALVGSQAYIGGEVAVRWMRLPGVRVERCCPARVNWGAYPARMEASALSPRDLVALEPTRGGDEGAHAQLAFESVNHEYHRSSIRCAGCCAALTPAAVSDGSERCDLEWELGIRSLQFGRRAPDPIHAATLAVAACSDHYAQRGLPQQLYWHGACAC